MKKNGVEQLSDIVFENLHLLGVEITDAETETLTLKYGNQTLVVSKKLLYDTLSDQLSYLQLKIFDLIHLT